MKLCVCGHPLVFTPETVNGACVFGDYSYILLVSCSHCHSTRAAIMWESEQAALDRVAEENSEPLAAE